VLEIEGDMFEGAHAAISLFDADGLQEQLCIVSESNGIKASA
jgi:hypothetical protein